MHIVTVTGQEDFSGITGCGKWYIFMTYDTISGAFTPPVGRLFGRPVLIVFGGKGE